MDVIYLVPKHLMIELLISLENDKDYQDLWKLLDKCKTINNTMEGPELMIALNALDVEANPIKQ